MQIQNRNQHNTVRTRASVKRDQERTKTSLELFPYSHLRFNPQERIQRLVSHCADIHQAVTFLEKFIEVCGNVLDQNVEKLAKCLEGPENMWSHKKTLFIDIDETLLTKINDPIPGSETILIETFLVHFKVRPFAFEFLKQMSCYYDLILFSASEQIYSHTFFHYFNQRTGNSIKEYLSRDFCIQAYKNIFFKDLRIVQSRELKDMILLDNSVFSFGVLLDNGVPIMSYDGSDTDKELQYIIPYLIQASSAADIRQFNKERLKLGEITKTVRRS